VSEPASNRLVASLERRFRTIKSRIDVAGRNILLLHPESAEDLIDERDSSGTSGCHIGPRSGRRRAFWRRILSR
jgi:hypothetical protein